MNSLSNKECISDKKCKRVYCCGIFDMCHLGHMILFDKIVKSFDEPIELIVGVISDKVCSEYKREPVISEEIRYETIKYCKNVNKIIKDAPLITDKNFILENNIDYVIIGEEYRNSNTLWYPGAVELKIDKYIDRFDSISTSDIIKKIKEKY